MPLKEEFERSGNWLFKRRSWLPLAILFPVGFAWTKYSGVNVLHSLGTMWAAICLAVSCVGLAVRVVTVGYSARGTSGRNRAKQVAQSLNSTGIYAAVRHPLYLGNFLMFLGIIMYPGIWWLCIMLSLVYWLYYERIMFAEEEFLRARFGDAYVAWATSTPAFLPRFSRVRRAEYPFSIRKVLKHEHTSVLGMAASFTMLDLMNNLVLGKKPVPGLFWLIVLATAVTLYFFLRIIIKKTSLLNEDNR
jgi:protein-S-isoprenylcysteine O-methyltransferase Ste14